MTRAGAVIGTAARLGGIAVWLLLAGCQRQAPAPPVAEAPSAAAPSTPATPSAPAADAGRLEDVIEHTPSYVVGISYPKGLEKYPGLVAQVRGYADAARAELMDAVEGLGNDRPTAPYELSLSFETVLDTPSLVVVAADGSRYTGGAHGEPLVARFVWLPQQQRLLTAQALVPSADGWAAIGDYVGARLHEDAEARVQADRLSPEESVSQLRNADKMIAEGTEAKAENFAQFQPLVDAGGRITAIRFVFPPYQVGPYSDGTRTADVPASVLLPVVAPEYADLFVH